MDRQQMEAVSRYICDALEAAETDDVAHPLRNAQQIVEAELELQERG